MVSTMKFLLGHMLPRKNSTQWLETERVGKQSMSLLLQNKISSLYLFMASLVAWMVKHLPTMQETWVWSLGQEDTLEKEMATHSSIHAWKISWTEEPGGLQSMGSQRVRHDWATSLHFTSLHREREVFHSIQHITERFMLTYFSFEYVVDNMQALCHCETIMLVQLWIIV